MINRNILDVGALDNTDAISIEEIEKELCKLEKSMVKSNNVTNVYNKNREKIWIVL